MQYSESDMHKMFTLLCALVGFCCALLQAGDACECGHAIQSRVIRGHDVYRGDYPWLAAVLKDGKIMCSASLISAKYALTAYHCVKEREPHRFKLLLGGHSMSTNYPDSITSDVENIIFYDNGTNHNRYDNIALLQLKEEVQFGRYIQPICIPKRHQSFDGKKATTIGWGDTLGNGTTSDVPLAGEVVVVDTSFCNKVIAKRNGTYIDSRFLCSGLYDGQAGACSGDGGSPLMRFNKNASAWEIIGIATANMGCTREEDYGYFVNVTHYSRWMRDNAESAGCMI